MFLSKNLFNFHPINQKQRRGNKMKYALIFLISLFIVYGCSENKEKQHER